MRERVVQVLSSIPGLSEPTARESLIEVLGFATVSSRVNLSGSTIAFAENLVGTLAADSVDQLVEFLSRLMGSPPWRERICESISARYVTRLINLPPWSSARPSCLLTPGYSTFLLNGETQTAEKYAI